MNSKQFRHYQKLIERSQFTFNNTWILAQTSPFNDWGWATQACFIIPWAVSRNYHFFWFGPNDKVLYVLVRERKGTTKSETVVKIQRRENGLLKLDLPEVEFDEMDRTETRDEIKQYIIDILTSVP